MITISTLRIIDYVVLGVSGAFFLIYIACALYAVPWNKERRQQSLTRDFNLFWKTRLCLQLSSALWMLFQWLRLEALWQPGSHIFDSRVTNWTGGGQLCRLYICISIGFMEPFCLFTAVLLCCNVLSKKNLRNVGWPNAWLLCLAVLLTAPFTAAQSVIAWMSVIIPGHDWESTSRPSTAGRYFLAPYVIGADYQCDNSDGKTCLLCFFPAASSIVGIIQAVLAALILWYSVRRVLNAVINRRLRRRLRLFRALFVIGLTALNALRAVTVTRGTPFSWAFQILWLVHFVSLPLLSAVYTLFLVLIPVRDTVKISKLLQREDSPEVQERMIPVREDSRESQLEKSGSHHSKTSTARNTDDSRHSPETKQRLP